MTSEEFNNLQVGDCILYKPTNYIHVLVEKAEKGYGTLNSYRVFYDTRYVDSKSTIGLNVRVEDLTELIKIDPEIGGLLYG